ncbi:MAG: DUF5399 family protein [Simkaniaceae bacterium]|nr:DUF5399 family protein [Simkaniaceae bacterium]
MADSRTIDDLGIDASVRWAHDRTFLDRSLIDESDPVAEKTEIDVYAPFYESEDALLLHTHGHNRQWADFSPPPGYLNQRMRIFVHRTIPSLGTPEHRESQVRKIRNLCETNAKGRKEKGGREGYAWEAEQEEREEKRASEALYRFFDHVKESDELLATINAGRSRYAKG